MCFQHVPRAEEETAARVKLEKENRELHAQLQETQDDLESEKDARQKVEKQRRQLNEVNQCWYTLVVLTLDCQKFDKCWRAIVTAAT